MLVFDTVSPSPSPARTAAGRAPPPPQPRRCLRGLPEARRPQGRRRRGVPHLPPPFPSSSRSRSSFVGGGDGNAGVGSGGWRLPMAGARRLAARLPMAGAWRPVAWLPMVEAQWPMICGMASFPDMLRRWWWPGGLGQIWQPETRGGRWRGLA
jgi:hypothetical protein